MTKPTTKELRALVGNPDVYAVQHKDGSWHPVREPLTAKVILAHREGDITVGTYIVRRMGDSGWEGPNGETDREWFGARTLVFDIDAADEKEQDKQTQGICHVLNDLGLEYGVEFSGRKGYHVWVVSDEYLPAETLARIGRGVREEAGYPSMEVFPKQTEVRDLGNLVKLPGGKHQVTGKANDFIGAVPGVNGANFLGTVAEKYPELGLRSRRADAPAVVEYPCIHSIQDGVKEGGRNIHLFQLAVMLRRWSLTDENVELLLRRANDAGEPLDDAELDGILENSRYSGPICNQLDDSVHCGDQCIIARHTGLYTRPGALKWAGEGEVVTVEVAERTEGGTVVELTHPDMVQGRAVLAEPAPRVRKDEK